MRELITEATTNLIIGLIGTAVMAGCLVATGAMILAALALN